MHPALGYKMVHGRVAPSAATIVLNHHQRMDGSGYAGRDAAVLEGSRIHVFARIVAVAAAFDELQFPATGLQRPTVQVLRDLLSPELLPHFDEQVLLALLAVVPPFTPGSVVRLSDGQWAVPIKHNPERPCMPIVQLIADPTSLATEANQARQVIDLSDRACELTIVACDDVEVSAYRFKIPAGLGCEAATANWI